MKTYDLRKGTYVRLADGRQAELFDSAILLTRLVKVDTPFGIESVGSYDISACLGQDGAWHEDLKYSREELEQRERREMR